jgi:hypothetical protein
MRTQTFCFSLLAAVVLLAAGCDEVEDRVIWSPDGSRAIVRVNDTLCLLDTNGNLSAPVASNVVSAAWLADSHGLVLLRSLQVTHWADAVRLLPADETAAVQSLAKGIPDLLRAGLALADGESTNLWDRFSGQFRMEHPELLGPAILCVLDTQSGALDQAIQAAKDPEKLRAEISDARTNKIAEVTVVLLGSGASTNASHIVERTLTDLQQARPSPSRKAVAFIRGGSLMVAPLDGSTNRVVVAERVEGNYDWTPDGKALVYAARFAEKWESGAMNLVRIERRTVIGPNGELAAVGPQPLAIGSSTFEPRVRCLPDGRVLFAGLQQRLPASATAEQEARLYCIDPASGTNAVPVTLPSPARALPQDLAAFAPSPDGRQIAIVESGSDAVAVLDVATGALEVVSPKHGWKSTTLPAWRDANELYFAALPEPSSSRPELLRLRKGSAPQEVSRSWPGAAASILLKKPSN